jgi:hypothetical protein
MRRTQAIIGERPINAGPRTIADDNGSGMGGFGH